MTKPYRLHYAPDNASLIIRLALESLGQPYDAVLVDRASQAQKAPAYLALNPNGLIPTLETKDGPLFETGAILLWLADRHRALAPAPDSPERAGFLIWLFFTSNTLHPAMRMMFYPEKYVGADRSAQIALRMQLRIVLGQHYETLNTLAGAGHRWFGAKIPSVLDYYVACCVRWTALYPAKDDCSWFDLGAYPHLHALAVHLDTCPESVAAQHAEGLGPDPFSAPHYAQPPEGSAT